MKTITITAQKGGVGKTSTCIHLAQALSLRGYRVLVIDLDAQCNATYSLNGENIEGRNALAMLVVTAAQPFIQNVAPNIDLVAGTIETKDASMILNNTGGQFKLQKALKPLKDNYDFCLIDTKPEVSQVTINALTASDYVIIPVECEIYSLQGLSQIKQLIDSVKDSYNPSIEVLGVLINKFDTRTTFTKEVLDTLEGAISSMNMELFETKVRNNIKIKEAQAIKKNLFEYAPKSNGAVDFQNVVNEVLERIK